MISDTPIADTQPASQRRFCAEWEPQRSVVLSLPDATMDWAYMLEEVRGCYREILRNLIYAGSHVTVLANSIREASRVFGSLPQQSVSYLEVPLNDTWVRDYGPLSVEETASIKPQGEDAATPQGENAAEAGAEEPSLRHRMLSLDFGFNGWGLKFAADRDNLANLRLKDRSPFSEGAYENCRGFVLEGGSVETDGHGTILTTTRCLCSPNRNGGLSKPQIERILAEKLGARRVLWLDHGALSGDDTDSHIDTLARLCPGDTILYAGPPADETDEQYEELTLMRRELQELTTAEGKPYNLIELPLPNPVLDPDDGHRLPATYTNYLVTGNAVLVPLYGQPRLDSLALKLIRLAFPDRQVSGIDCRALIRQHGSLHCATMQLTSLPETLL